MNEKTGGKYGDKIDQGVDKAKDGLDGLDGQDDDIANKAYVCRCEGREEISSPRGPSLCLGLSAATSKVAGWIGSR